MSDALADLIARVEAAQGPDREMDFAIAAAVGWPDSPHSHQHARRYTEHLDAALTLVPDGTDRWAVWRGVRGSCASVEHDKPHMWAAHAGRAATPALALCAAAMRARMARDG